MTIIVILGVAVVIIIIYAIVASKAPYGYEDENGFHYGDKQE